MHFDPENMIKEARDQLESLGWTIEETLFDGGKCRIILTKDGEMISWGIFKRNICWAEAYRSIVGRSWLELLRILKLYDIEPNKLSL